MVDPNWWNERKRDHIQRIRQVSELLDVRLAAARGDSKAKVGPQGTIQVQEGQTVGGPFWNADDLAKLAKAQYYLVKTFKEVYNSVQKKQADGAGLKVPTLTT